MLTCRKHVETTALKRKKGLSVLKAMAAKGIEQSHLFYGLGLTTMAQTNLLKLDRVQNKSYSEPPNGTIMFMLDLPPM